MKLLLVGDLHLKRQNLDESKKILDWVLSKAQELNGKGFKLVFMGDQYSDMGTVRVELVQLMSKFCTHLKDNKINTIFLVGNHDYNSDATATAMVAHEALPAIRVVNDLYTEEDKDNFYVFVPFFRHNEQFTSMISNLKTLTNKKITIFCHQEFEGSKYENGWYSPYGIPAETIPEDIKVISGHIHMAQEFGPIWYVGLPRQLIISDAGSKNGIYLLDTETNKRDFIETPEDVAEKFQHIEITEDLKKLPKIPKGSKVYVDIYGASDFIIKTMAKLKDGVHVRQFVNRPLQSETAIKESDGIAESFSSYVKKYSKENKPKDLAVKEAVKLVTTMCPILRGQRGNKEDA